MAKVIFVFVFCVLLGSRGAQAEDGLSFPVFLQQMADRAVAEGVRAEVLTEAFQDLTPDPEVLRLDRAQPERKLSFERYESAVVSKRLVREGKAFLKRNAPLLKAVEAEYGVPREVLVALLGIESDFGRQAGSFPILRSLATLAYDGRRSSFFQKELLVFLHILDEEGRPLSSFRGSWSGAMGQPQFMPGTYARYAVDGDGDGHRDIWRNRADVLASMAHYLVAEGWQRGEGWGREVRLTKPVLLSRIGLEAPRLSLQAWQGLGIRSKNGAHLPLIERMASLIQPDGPHGRSFLVYDNFRAVLRWNRSTFFATSVGLLADRLKTP